MSDKAKSCELPQFAHVFVTEACSELCRCLEKLARNENSHTAVLLKTCCFFWGWEGFEHMWGCGR